MLFFKFNLSIILFFSDAMRSVRLWIMLSTKFDIFRASAFFTNYIYILSGENEQADAERDGRTRLARPKSLARTETTGKC